MPLTVEPSSQRASAAVDRLRDDYVPAAFGATADRVLVGGAPAEARDSFAVDAGWLPIVIAFVLTLSFVLLTLAFRSIAIPLTAIAVNLLSVGAAYGILVLVFQKGVGIDLLGFTKVERIDAWVPIFLFSVLFGLSMDYQVFLLSRIHERWAATGDTPGAIVHGVASTARLITGAAAIIIVVFAGFATGQLVAFQEMGFGIAIALALDATLVRLLLIPAAMRLLGERNWYLPRWLAWLPDVQVEGHRPTRLGRHAGGPARRRPGLRESTAARASGPVAPSASEGDRMNVVTRFVLDHKRLVLGFWLVVTIAAFAAIKPAGNALSQQFNVPGREGFETNQSSPRSTATAATSRRSCRSCKLPQGTTVDSPGVSGELDAALAKVQAALPDARTASYASTHDRAFVSADGRTTFALVYIPAKGGVDPGQAEARRAQAALAGVTVGGSPVAGDRARRAARRGGRRRRRRHRRPAGDAAGGARRTARPRLRLPLVHGDRAAADGDGRDPDDLPADLAAREASPTSR